MPKMEPNFEPFKLVGPLGWLEELDSSDWCFGHLANGGEPVYE
jgi:hypothetical protein